MTGWTRRDLGEYKTGQHLKKSQTEPKLSRQEYRWSTEYFSKHIWEFKLFKTKQIY